MDEIDKWTNKQTKLFFESLQDLGTVTGSRMTKDAGATIQWASPELLNCERVSFETDIW